MQISAMNSAVSGMMRASALMDFTAAQIANDGPATVAATSSTATPRVPDDGLITSVPNLLMAGELFKANAFVARVAQETYQAALDWNKPAT